MMQSGIARVIGTFKSAGEAARSPPRSSRIGIMEMMKMMASFDTFPPRRAVRPCTIVSVIVFFLNSVYILFFFSIICDSIKNFNSFYSRIPYDFQNSNEQFPKYVPDYAPSLPEHRLETITGNPPLFQAKILQVFSFKEKWQIEQENSDDFAKKL